MRVYRLVKERFADTALDGSGAKVYGGRWNRKGHAVVYASDSIALAALELLVHLHRSEVLNEYRLARLDLPDDEVLLLDDAGLPANWREDPAPVSTAAIGAAWLTGGQSLALSVPSVLIPQQRNLLLNPAHGRAGGVFATATLEPFDFDPRFVR
ncbi:MAG: RES domain-containing protein [Thiocapsa sp.]|uniref:RES family NAD+ phosphorylase n=1 Tax=Thiocapsa sp. TaxID=2024551 RepID=UPI001BD066D6|nr:RES family NAD+ phosphorylase [Thiocapsa sp.]QVL48930.1 MAG: RES domain-containing protein [Thiocapsa sp.]